MSIIVNKRLNYIDNLRSITIALLVLYHAAIAYNSWGEANYIFFERVNPIAAVVVLITPWFMPLMFLLAGVLASFSLKKRSAAEFVKERLKRLGIPLVLGIVFINPIMCYVADKTHNGYSGNYLQHYVVYFSKFTDLTGYDGGFTLGHFWFIAVLLVISCLGCGVIKVIDKACTNRKRLLVAEVIIIVLAIAAFDVTFFGKKMLTYFFLYFLGYYLFSSENFIHQLISFKWILICLWIVASVINTTLFVYVGQYELLNTVCNYLAFVFGLPALFCLSYEHLNFSNVISKKAAELSYVFYIVHFPIVILCQYIISMTGIGCIMNFVLSLSIAYPLSFLVSWWIGKTKYIRTLFGLNPVIVL